ncbi:DMT family transporter [Bacillus massiliigorillae]|uniref:DMT family transporter n=1 Tax=Bacillus massiliigorillae TaxID=1243664 RepID=UPI0003A937B0|nr:DMT family transporter [Bacillus massiliigorillae]
MNKGAVIKLSTSMVIFGTIGFFSNLTGLPVLELVFLRCVCATLFLIGYWLISGKYKQEIWDRKELIYIILSGIFLVLNWLLLFYAFRQTSITIAISIYNLAPLIALFINIFLFKERVERRIIIATIVAFLGTILITFQFDQSSAGNEVMGGLLALAAAVFYGAIISLGRKIQKSSSYMTTFIQTFIGIVMLMPFVSFVSYTHLTNEGLLFSIVTGIVHTGIVYLLFYDSIRYLSAGIASVLIFLDPLVAIVLDIFITGFIPGPLQIIGVIIIFASLGYTVKYSQTNKEQQ